MLFNKFCKTGLLASWGDVAFGATHGLLSVEEVARYALSCIDESASDDVLPALLDLAYGGLPISDAVHVCESLASPEELSAAKDRWEYAAVRDVLARDVPAEQKLKDLDDVYALFGYPEEMEDFVYYMPAREGLAESEVGALSPRERLLAKAEGYLRDKGTEIGLRS